MRVLKQMSEHAISVKARWIAAVTHGLINGRKRRLSVPKQIFCSPPDPPVGSVMQPQTGDIRLHAGVKLEYVITRKKTCLIWEITIDSD